MEKVVRKYSSLEAADEADDEFYRDLDGSQRLALLLEMILPPNPDDAVIQRCARVYPLAQSREG